MGDLIDRQELLKCVAMHKWAAKEKFNKAARNKRQKNYYEVCAYTEATFDTWEDAETLIMRFQGDTETVNDSMQTLVVSNNGKT